MAAKIYVTGYISPKPRGGREDLVSKDDQRIVEGPTRRAPEAKG